jgi:hypothetical protein
MEDRTHLQSRVQMLQVTPRTLTKLLLVDGSSHIHVTSAALWCPKLLHKPSVSTDSIDLPGA